jgi:hypothetical protein
MKKFLIIIIVLAASFAFCSCGSSEPEQPTAYEPTAIEVENADGVNVYSVIYDIDNTDTEAWSGYDTDEINVNTAVNGIKECMQRDDWTDDSVVYGYAKEALLKNMMYQYGYNGIDGDYDSIKLYQVGVYNDDYVLQGELD